MQKVQKPRKPISLKKGIQSSGLFISFIGIAGNIFIYYLLLPSFPFGSDLFMWAIFLAFLLFSEGLLILGLIDFLLPYHGNTAKYIIKQEQGSASIDIKAVFAEIDQDLNQSEQVFGREVVIGEKWLLVNNKVVKRENVEGIFIYWDRSRHGVNVNLVVYGYPSSTLYSRTSEHNPHLPAAYDALVSLYPNLPCGKTAKEQQEFAQQR